MKQKFFEERVDKGSIKVRKRLDYDSTTARLRLDYGSTTTRKRTLFATIIFLLTLGISQVWATDYYTPTADEVIILKDNMSDATNGYGTSTHGAFSFAAEITSKNKQMGDAKCGDPSNNGAATSSNVTGYKIKGNGGVKNLTLTVSGCSKVIVYHQSHDERTIKAELTPNSGDASTSQGLVSTYYTEIALDGTKSYSIFVYGLKVADSSKQDFIAYAVKLIKAGGEEPEEPEAPTITAPISDQSAEYTVGSTITALSITASGSPAPTYQWYSNDSKSTTGATAIAGATSASYTPSNAAESDAYYYCVATNDSGSEQSPYFHVTVAAAKTIGDLVAITDDWTFTPSATISAGTMAGGDRLFGAGASDCDYNNGMRVKENRALAFKLNNGAKVKVTFVEKSDSGTPREMQLGTATNDDDNKAYGHSGSSPVVFDVNADGVVYLTASSDLRFSKLEIMYPHTITYALNGGTGTTPTQASQYAGETFTVHNGVTGVTAPAGKEFAKWKDQDNTDVAAGATYTMPAKDVTLTAQWRNETVKYAVTYDLNGYSAGVAPVETNKAAGDVFAIKAAPAWTDHNFLGWKCNIDAATYQAADNYTMTAAATTFTAQWQAFFTITYKDGETVLGTEKVNTGSAPEAIAEPTKELKTFLGWTLVGGTAVVDPTTLTENTVLVAKWGDFDGCAYLAVDLTAEDALKVGDNVALTASSFGGGVKVAGLSESGKIKYSNVGLALSGGGADSLRVTIDHQMQVGTKITVFLQSGGTSARGLNLLTQSGGTVDGGTTLGWSTSTTNGETGTFSYTVKASDGLEGQKVFHLQRNNTVYLKYISVEDCAPQDYTVTYKDGETTLGTEYVFENEHPTAADVSTRKNGYVFDGWAETAGGAVVNLNSIIITAEKTLYAKYSARDCSSSGTKFKFQLKTDLTSGNVFSSYPNSVKATTENYLADLVGGEVEFAVTGGSNNRLQFYDEKAIGFANSSDAKVTIVLDCPLQENDEIRYINYAGAGNSITLSDGTNSTVLNGNGKEEMQTFVVTAEWETTDSYELTMIRNEKTAKLTYFEIYRRPALESVTLEDMNLKKGKTGTPVVTLYPADASVSSEVWEITACTATGTTIDAATGLITAGETAGDITVKVTVNGDKEATCTVKVVAGFDVPRPVTETTTWNWATLAVAAGDGPTINNPDTVLANYLSGEEWEMLAGNAGGRPYRHNSNYMCYQGTSLYFKAAVPGILTVNAGYTSSDKVCNVSVNGHVIGETPASHANLNKIVVASGDVYITATSMRIYSMKFDTNLSAYELTDNVLDGYSRELQPGVLSTTCLPSSGVIAGASVFEIAYMDYEADGVTPYKIYFDEVVNGEMEAGVPYIVLANEGSTQMRVFYTDNANESAKSKNGLVGYMGEKTSLAANDYFIYNNMFYYVSAADAASGRIKITGNRAYLNLADIPGYSTSVPAPGRRRMAMGNGDAPKVPTAVDTMQADKVPCTKVLIDGRFFILRGEKMYDMTGQLVK